MKTELTQEQMLEKLNEAIRHSDFVLTKLGHLYKEITYLRSRIITLEDLHDEEAE
tara:strand:- start:1052 stop:1216 length:165 start_codon:yes stop_codon:yes gene_type:complete